jgi:hypothetical protein
MFRFVTRNLLVLPIWIAFVVAEQAIRHLVGEQIK